MAFLFWLGIRAREALWFDRMHFCGAKAPFHMQCRKHKKMQSARGGAAIDIPLIVPLSFLENQPHFFSHAT